VGQVPKVCLAAGLDWNAPVHDIPLLQIVIPATGRSSSIGVSGQRGESLEVPLPETPLFGNVDAAPGSIGFMPIGLNPNNEFR
jgi:hypothetical protein